ncbi:Osmotically-inducible protein OsmY, contains BON domain [Pricia antarctica]|uniref:Osmotically-inducible protein OsmY, contains BON domain n=1 Tax=Pricia antarctica TaxID=641691 RepID=A0A1G7CUQ4_9FLAO|nr:BON domain-containing protein [Pricia antarctica]SDE42953.1 Osmotically-inducible protein OsmY, contains BON domain [Pricia antarctica]
MKTDQKLKTDVLAELAWEPRIDETQIGVIVENGVVTLTGFVDDFYKKVAAERAVKRVKGVKAMAGDIEVKYGDAFKETDKEVAKAIVRRFAWNTVIPYEKIAITVRDGWVELSGEVEWAYQKDGAKRVVEKMMGVKGVMNNIDIEQKVVPSDIKNRIIEAFHRAADIDAQNIEVDTEGSTVKLSGTVHSIAEKEDAQRAVFRATGVTKIRNELKVAFNS